MGKRLSSFLIIVLCGFIASTTCDNAGFKISVSPNGLNYAVQVAAKVVQQKLSTIKIPDFNGKADGGIIGTVDYSVTGITVGSVSIGAPTIKAAGTVQSSIPGITIRFSGNWGYRQENWPHVSDSGSMDIIIANSAVGLSVSVGTSSAGEPTCQAQAVVVYLNDFEIDLHGGASWLYNILVQLFNDNVKDAVSGQIQTEIVSLINNDLSQLLQTLPLKQQISTVGVLDLTLVANPIINNYICHPGKGLFSSATNPSPPPFGPTVPLPDETNAAYHVQFFISDYVGNSFFYSMYKSGGLNFVVDYKNLPPAFPVKFNTNAFEFLIPQLFFKYPGLNMSATFTPTQSPTLKISGTYDVYKRGVSQQNALFEVSATYSAAVFVIQPPNTYVPVFTLDIDTIANCKAFNIGTTLKAQIDTVNITLSVASSEIGTFQTTALQVITNTAVNSVVVPEINNSTLGNGFAIPVIDGVQLVNPVIGSSNGFISITSNIVYNGYTFQTKEQN